ncbi:ethanolamine utilization cob(I)yrinic acid a,c-diamide adenosyltransferase EutT, partial [Escherichia coli]
QAENRLTCTVYVMMILSVTKQPLTVKQIHQRLGETQ